MSKRAEQAALREYPPSYSEVKRNAKRIQSYKVDTHKPIRQIYIKGYEQAAKDILDTVSDWLRENIHDYLFMSNGEPHIAINGVIEVMIGTINEEE